VAVLTSDRTRQSGSHAFEDAAWIVEDEPAAAALAADLCEASRVDSLLCRDGQRFLEALHVAGRPRLLILDWRLERGLSAPLFMAARHHAPDLPVIYWTGTAASALPQMIREDARVRIVDKASGTAGFETALRWALEATAPARG